MNRIATVANSTKEVTPSQLQSVKKELERIEKILADNINQKAMVTKKLGSFFSTDGLMEHLRKKEVTNWQSQKS